MHSLVMVFGDIAGTEIDTWDQFIDNSGFSDTRMAGQKRNLSFRSAFKASKPSSVRAQSVEQG